MTKPDKPVPVLTIDGPSGSGKGTISRAVADALGWHLLDSGALYRAVGYAAGMAGIDLSDAAAVTRCAETTKIAFRDPKDGGDTRVIVNGHDATDELRTETCGAAASAIAAIPAVRAALLDKQHSFRRAPGLVADGRDMGTIVFRDAPYKIFLTASADERARRRPRLQAQWTLAFEVATCTSPTTSWIDAAPFDERTSTAPRMPSTSTRPLAADTDTRISRGSLTQRLAAPRLWRRRGISTSSSSPSPLSRNASAISSSSSSAACADPAREVL